MKTTNLTPDYLTNGTLGYLAPDAAWAQDFPLAPSPELVPQAMAGGDPSLPRSDDSFTAPGEDLLDLFRANADGMAEFARLAQGTAPVAARPTLPSAAKPVPAKPPAPKPPARKWWELVVHAVPARKPRRRLAAPAGRIAST